MDASLQIHLDKFIPNVMRVTSDGIDKWRWTTSPKKFFPAVSIVVTDDVGFANNAIETNEVVILISDQSETTTGVVKVISSVGGPDIGDSVWRALLEKFP